MKRLPVSRLYAMELVSQSAAIYTLFVIMFSERGGLSLSQVGLILGIFSITTIVSEVPTGVIADHFSRKWSIVLAKLSLAAGMICWLLFPGLGGYILGIVFMGISESFSSGAIQAYLYEQIGEDKTKFTHFNSRLWSVMMMGWLVGSGLASVIGPRYEVLLVLSTITSLGGAVIAMTLPSDRVAVVARRTPGRGSMAKTSKEAFKYIFSSQVILTAVLSIIVIRVIVDVLIEYIPLYYRSAGADTRIIPIIFLLETAFQYFYFGTANKLPTFYAEKNSLSAL